MKISTAFPSSTLKAADIEDGDLILTVTDVQIETVGQGKDAEDKPHVYFQETEKKLVLNKTNAATIAKLYGDDTDDWRGKRIALFATEVEFAGSMTMAIRVRMRAPVSRPPQDGQRQAPQPQGARPPGAQPQRSPQRPQARSAVDPSQEEGEFTPDQIPF